jgi:hypothetical protein
MFKRVSLPFLNSFATKIIVKTSENSRQEVSIVKTPKTFVSGNNIFRKRKSCRFSDVSKNSTAQNLTPRAAFGVQITPDGHVVIR